MKIAYQNSTLPSTPAIPVCNTPSEQVVQYTGSYGGLSQFLSNNWNGHNLLVSYNGGERTLMSGSYTKMQIYWTWM